MFDNLMSSGKIRKIQNEIPINRIWCDCVKQGALNKPFIDRKMNHTADNLIFRSLENILSHHFKILFLGPRWHFHLRLLPLKLEVPFPADCHLYSNEEKTSTQVLLTCLLDAKLYHCTSLNRIHGNWENWKIENLLQW